jgi:hypothetical protein
MADEKNENAKDEAPKGRTSAKAKGTPEDRDADPRLDNRVGEQRPRVDAELKPQQVHGGYPGDETEYEDPPSADAPEFASHRSVGPHGRGEQTGPSSED